MIMPLYRDARVSTIGQDLHLPWARNTAGDSVISAEASGTRRNGRTARPSAIATRLGISRARGCRQLGTMAA